jgi:hypothetical protein
MGWAEESWMARCKPCQAEMEGSREKERKWLRVSSAWDRRRSQRSGGNEVILYVLMARSEGLARWLTSGTC